TYFRFHCYGPLTRERDLGAHDAGLDACGDRRFDGTQLRVAVQCVEQVDEAIVTDRCEHELRAPVAPIEARHRRTDTLWREGAVERRAGMQRRCASGGARELARFPCAIACFGERRGVRRACE